jgi:hypothetical protein
MNASSYVSLSCMPLYLSKITAWPPWRCPRQPPPSPWLPGRAASPCS